MIRKTMTEGIIMYFDESKLQIIERTERNTIDQIHGLLIAAHSANASVDYGTTNISEEELIDRIKVEGTVFLSVYDDELVGMILIGLEKSTMWYAKGKTACLRYVAVHPDFGGHGIASKMLDECLAWAKERNYNTLMWNTAANNKAAIATAKKNRFHLVDYIKFKQVNHPSIRLVKWINIDEPTKWKRKLFFAFRKAKVIITGK